MKKSRTIKVDYLARVEGEGALLVKIKGGAGDRREASRSSSRRASSKRFCAGANFSEAPDITARICGICPVAYQMSACHAMEDAFGVKIAGPIRASAAAASTAANGSRATRCTSICCTRPTSSVTKTPSSMAKDHPPMSSAACSLKKAGNEIVSLLGGREIHPINVRVGGFYRVPTKAGTSRRWPKN